MLLSVSTLHTSARWQLKTDPIWQVAIWPRIIVRFLLEPLRNFKPVATLITLGRLDTEPSLCADKESSQPSASSTRLVPDSIGRHQNSGTLGFRDEPDRPRRHSAESQSPNLFGRIIQQHWNRPPRVAEFPFACDETQLECCTSSPMELCCGGAPG